MSDDPGERRSASGGTSALHALVVLVVVAGCSTRHAGRDTRTQSASVSSTDGGAAEEERAARPDAATGASAGGGVDGEVRTAAGSAVAAPGPTFAVAAAGGTPVVRGPDGGTTALELRGEATLGGVEWVSGVPAWRVEDSRLVAEVASEAARWRLTIDGDSSRPVLTLRVVVRYTADVLVEHEELALRFPEAAAPVVLGRDLAPRSVESGTTHLTDPWTPLEVRVDTPSGLLTVVRAEGFPSAATRLAGDGLTVRLELDDAGNHPYRPYAECHARYARNHARETLDATPRRAGEEVEHAVELWFGETAPLRPGRFPAGRRAAVVFTSHADQASAPRTRAVLWGHSDPDHETFGRRGLLGHGLSLTLTAFAERGTQDDLADADYAQVLAAAAAAGVEVGPHSVTAGPDDRATVERLLAAFDGFAPATWIDHQPDTNCEAVMSAPALPGRGSKYDIAGALRAHDYRFVWTEPDLEPPDGGLNLLGPRRPERRPAVLFRNLHYREGDWAPWMFRTAWLFVDREAFVAALAPRALERLAEEQGLLLAHVYLEAYETSGRRANRSLVESDGAGFRVRDGAEAAFAALGAAQASGVLWVPSLRAFGDHWTAAAEARVEPRADGTVVLCGGTRAVTAMSWRVSRAGATVAVDGQAPDGVRADDGGTTFWVDLPAGSERVVAVTVDGAPARPYPAGRTVVEDR